MCALTLHSCLAEQRDHALRLWHLFGIEWIAFSVFGDRETLVGFLGVDMDLSRVAKGQNYL